MRKFKENFKIAIEMKWKGFKYPEIAKRLGVSLDTVKSWFRHNGSLKQHYQDYADDQIILAEQRRGAEKNCRRCGCKNTLKHTKTHEKTPKDTKISCG